MYFFVKKRPFLLVVKVQDIEKKKKKKENAVPVMSEGKGDI